MKSEWICINWRRERWMEMEISKTNIQIVACRRRYNVNKSCLTVNKLFIFIFWSDECNTGCCGCSDYQSISLALSLSFSSLADFLVDSRRFLFVLLRFVFLIFFFFVFILSVYSCCSFNFLLHRYDSHSVLDNNISVISTVSSTARGTSSSPYWLIHAIV